MHLKSFQNTHKLIVSRLVPDRKLPPAFSEKYKHLLAKLPPSDPPLSPFIPLPRSLPPIKPRDPNRATRIMSILNVTPDSFSDGGNNYNIDNAALTATIRSHIAAGATIVDIGGQSTRPGAEQVTPKEELARILPAISIIRSLPEAENIAISIDTYHASVARAAIEAGADIINDVSAGQLDPLMLSTVAELGCTICLMHMRGTPETMNTLTNYGPTGVVSRVSDELVRSVQAAQRAGIRRWRIILDPGIGFAKTQDQNITLIRQLRELRETPRLWGLPWLVGVSRKGFIGKITGVEEPEKRVGGTAAVVTASIAEGADIVRVHDVDVMAQVAKMADALYRPDTLPVAKSAAGTEKNVKIKYVYKGAVKRQ
jgi:2-amino-4-hydroxy-6-hydroxymethyldihydropteridine diphosphokinase/dihydropteroate synthase